MDKLLSPDFARTFGSQEHIEIDDANVPFDIFKVDVKAFLEQFNEAEINSAPLKQITDSEKNQRGNMSQFGIKKAELKAAISVAENAEKRKNGLNTSKQKIPGKK